MAALLDRLHGVNAAVLELDGAVSGLSGRAAAALLSAVAGLGVLGVGSGGGSGGRRGSGGLEVHGLALDWVGRLGNLNAFLSVHLRGGEEAWVLAQANGAGRGSAPSPARRNRMQERKTEENNIK